MNTAINRITIFTALALTVSFSWFVSSRIVKDIKLFECSDRANPLGSLERFPTILSPYNLYLFWLTKVSIKTSIKLLAHFHSSNWSMQV